ncbi:hypothetical protein X738_12465 [Mesorhizobium sp. LNHC209A00]|nr:hypothetical protein X738_12465 [Mesorhizobium sp. LNHC209A00]
MDDGLLFRKSKRRDRSIAPLFQQANALSHSELGR